MNSQKALFYPECLHDVVYEEKGIKIFTPGHSKFDPEVGIKLFLHTTRELQKTLNINEGNFTIDMKYFTKTYDIQLSQMDGQSKKNDGKAWLITLDFRPEELNVIDFYKDGPIKVMIKLNGPRRSRTRTIPEFSLKFCEKEIINNEDESTEIEEDDKQSEEKKDNDFFEVDQACFTLNQLSKKNSEKQEDGVNQAENPQKKRRVVSPSSSSYIHQADNSSTPSIEESFRRIQFPSIPEETDCDSKTTKNIRFALLETKKKAVDSFARMSILTEMMKDSIKIDRSVFEYTKK
tara:strand:- start:2594 stop:3466 length:873 start_codon:yes stop_codon:yes gene_type:complete